MTETQRQRRHAVLLTLTILWMGVIWAQSLLPGDLSSQESGAVLTAVNTFLTNHALPLLSEFIVRKTAHFVEYALFGLLLTASGLYAAARRRWLYRGLWLLAVPVCDECLQLVAGGRTGKPADVLLDLCGALFGVACAFLLRRLLHRP